MKPSSSYSARRRRSREYSRRRGGAPAPRRLGAPALPGGDLVASRVARSSATRRSPLAEKQALPISLLEPSSRRAVQPPEQHRPGHPPGDRVERPHLHQEPEVLLAIPTRSLRSRMLRNGRAAGSSSRRAAESDSPLMNWNPIRTSCPAPVVRKELALTSGGSTVSPLPHRLRDVGERVIEPASVRQHRREELGGMVGAEITGLLRHLDIGTGVALAEAVAGEGHDHLPHLCAVSGARPSASAPAKNSPA